MIREIKKKQTKYGTVLSFAHNDEQVAELLKHSAIAAYAIVHKIGQTNDKLGFGQMVVGHKIVPKFKNVIGHYIGQIRGGELVVLLKPEASLMGDASGIYNHLDANRIERAYAMYLGSADHPTAIILSSTLMEHLFHAIPDQLDMSGDWIGFVDGWLKKAIFGGRYFDGNALASLAVKEKIPAAEYKIEPDDAPRAIITTEGKVRTEPEAEVAKRRPGRPKTKK